MIKWTRTEDMVRWVRSVPVGPVMMLKAVESNMALVYGSKALVGLEYQGVLRNGQVVR